MSTESEVMCGRFAMVGNIATLHVKLPDGCAVLLKPFSMNSFETNFFSQPPEHEYVKWPLRTDSNTPAHLGRAALAAPPAANAKDIALDSNGYT